jgi:hypothetical protein
VQWVAEHGRLPVVTFTAGGIATPADAALCMQLGADGVFVGSGIFKSSDPSTRAKAIVEATTHYRDADVLARVSQGLGDAMSGLSAAALAPEELLETRGWSQHEGTHGSLMGSLLLGRSLRSRYWAPAGLSPAPPARSSLIATGFTAPRW